METKIRLLPKTQRGKIGKCWSCDSEKDLHYKDYSVDGKICLDCYDTSYEIEQLLVNNPYIKNKKHGIRHPNPNEISESENH